LSDLSTRAIDALRVCDLVTAEDTRIASRLLSSLGLKKATIRIDEHASDSALKRVIGRAEAGETIVVTSDAGTPGISDPGAKLVDLAYEAGVTVDAIPGPSAVTNALALSGFFAQRYAFLGFLPRKKGGQLAEFEPYASSTYSLVFFESGARVGRTLSVALEALSDRRAAICREMTKLHQEVIRGRLSELAQDVPNLKGEVTVVIEGARRNLASSP